MDGAEVKLLGIDPGTYESAYCVLEGGIPTMAAKISNEALLVLLRIEAVAPTVVIETIFPRGQAVGIETMTTQLWAGRFWEAAEHRGCNVHSIDRQDVRFAICGSLDTRDSSVRQGLIDYYGGDAAARRGQKCLTCKGKKELTAAVTCNRCHGATHVMGNTRPVKCPACKGRGTRKSTIDCMNCDRTGWAIKPGPLASFAADQWAALAIALGWKLRQQMKTKSA